MKHEQMVYTPPTQEEIQALVDSAIQRIEVIDGVDYLDGHKLPPDDDIPYILRDNIGIYSNSNARSANIKTIAQTGTPLFTKEVDHTYADRLKPRERNPSPVGRFIRKIFIF